MATSYLTVPSALNIGLLSAHGFWHMLILSMNYAKRQQIFHSSSVYRIPPDWPDIPINPSGKQKQAKTPRKPWKKKVKYMMHIIKTMHIFQFVFWRTSPGNLTYLTILALLKLSSFDIFDSQAERVSFFTTFLSLSLKYSCAFSLPGQFPIYT